MGNRIRACVVAVVVVSIVAVLSPASAPAQTVQPLVGALHEHSGYSDGWPGSRPQTYYDSGRSFGLDFMGGSEHSDNADVPIVASEYCLDPLVAPSCAFADPIEPANSFRKWDATLEQARAASTPTFTGFRGFEWTSDRYGHVNVYFSQHDVNAKIDGGYATMESFYSWFTTAASLGGGSDGIATFNHPGDKSLSDSDSAFNWNDFTYDPEADPRMVGIEVFNDRGEFADAGRGGPYPEGSYVHALDKGWHLGAIGAEDLGHRYEDDWGGPTWAKTVILAEDRSERALKAAMLARRFYAIRRSGLSLDYTVDGRPMGSRITRTQGAELSVRADFSDPTATLELVTSGGRIVASGLGELAASPEASTSDRYYFVRARAADGRPVAYSSPVWVSALPPSGPATGEWLAGDLHVHTCFSHDAFCPPSDDNTGPDEFYTLSLNVGQRFLEASARGLDYLAITDHNDVRSARDPDFGAFGVTGVSGYENSLRGHAQMLGASRVYDKGDSSASAVNAIANQLRAEGGTFQINHPADSIEAPFESCADTSVLDWSYGYEVPPDTLEVWNPTSSIQFAERYLECWLERGARVGVTGGSDSHWLSTLAVQGVGNPTTWVFAGDNSPTAILAAIRDGRTTVSRTPPAQGGGPFLLEADANRDGVFESMVGDTVLSGTPMRVRALGQPAAGLVKVRANGQTIVEGAPLGADGELRFNAPATSGWVRANLMRAPDDSTGAPGCDPNGAPVATCAYDYLMAAITSPIYVDSGSYARPKSASPSNVPLVPAFEECGEEANASHGAPLAAPSCNPPLQSSDFLTLGAPDANGNPVRSSGTLELKVLGESPIDSSNGDQADVGLTARITDVRNKSDLTDYTGELRAVVGLRITDRYNGASVDEPATVADTVFGFNVSCAGTAGPEGSSCNVATTSDAVTTGIVREGQRAIWQLGQVQVFDGGADGDADTTGDNTLFAVQGLFAP